MSKPAAQVPRARAARSNKAGRFETYDTVQVDDGWGGDHGSDPSLVTEIREEVARSLITYNRSPDLPFDRSINPYRGCEHGCIYCFARPTHAFLGLSPGLDFETRLVARPNAAQVLTRELSARTYNPATIAIGTNTDPYQPVERDLKITRACLQVLAETRHPVAIVTKGALIERDLDILSKMAAEDLVRVGISVTTLDPDLSRRMEPRAPTPRRRLATIERLATSGVDVRIMASPLVPGLTDHELEAILEAGVKAGARHASWIMLRLPREVSELWQEWIWEHYPGRANKVLTRLREMHGGELYDPRWNHRMRGEGLHAEMISKRFQLALTRLGIANDGTPLRTDLFKPPTPIGGQMTLF